MADEGKDLSREEQLAEIRARVEALRQARGGGAVETAATTGEAPTPQTPPAARATPADAPGPATPAVEGRPAPAATAGQPVAEGEPGADLSREERLAQIKARAEALRAARAGGTAPPAPAATPSPAPAAQRPATARPAPTQLDVPVTSLNPGGRPGTPPQAAALEAVGTINQGVEIRGDPGEQENLKKLLGGLGGYPNPLRGGAWQVDYRYYAEAKRRLHAAGYTITERNMAGRPVGTWDPVKAGWTRVASS